MVRKTSVSLCLGGSAFFILIVANFGGEEHFSSTLIFIMLSYMCVGMSVAGTVINPSDLAPFYAGALFGVMNSIGAIPGSWYILCVYVYATDSLGSRQNSVDLPNDVEKVGVCLMQAQEKCIFCTEHSIV